MNFRKYAEVDSPITAMIYVIVFDRLTQSESHSRFGFARYVMKKSAVLYDYMQVKGGAESVTLALCNEVPDIDLVTAFMAVRLFQRHLYLTSVSRR